VDATATAGEAGFGGAHSHCMNLEGDMLDMWDVRSGVGDRRKKIREESQGRGGGIRGERRGRKKDGGRRRGSR
jgi:hypothetical protein